MTVFDRLRTAVETAQAEQDLPDFLALDIAAILQRREDFTHLEEELNELVEKVEMYDTYGQTGYLGMGVNNAILQKTLDKILKRDQVTCSKSRVPGEPTLQSCKKS
ncbi:hypothetical protein GEOBRER4_n0226 [Citrifermentans bremense]|uniref:Uncharacterized protein n=1 Tax=Citrifermentans bremense TaxID=60035 RepID=A0A6S6M137_9BACT|nr:hypothetical protein [Citrifermentans bremense]BCG45471.1 hypothetical protein GEOBRER4_n0226 [Citrifermentans bremense]